MSIAVSQPLHVPYEPFGQTGIRQYVGSFSALMCAAMVAFCLTLWYRSLSVVDALEFYHSDTRTIFMSSTGRLNIAQLEARGMPEGSSWGYSSRAVRRSRFDSWDDSIWKTIGVEFIPSYNFRGQVGWVLRVKYPVAALAFGILPAVHVARQMHRNRRIEAAAATPGLCYCPRCGRPVGKASTRCDCCGRDFR
jgi:hypothetical protein